MARRHSVFVPNNFMGSRHETAVLLVGTAREFGISQQDIASSQMGYFITPELEALIYDEPSEEEQAGQVGLTAEEVAADLVTEDSTTQTSGNRAAKKNTTTQKGTA